MRRLEKAVHAQNVNDIAALSHKTTGLFGAIHIFSASKLCSDLELAARYRDMNKM
jgi:hypothetical protein